MALVAGDFGHGAGELDGAGGLGDLAAQGASQGIELAGAGIERGWEARPEAKLRQK